MTRDVEPEREMVRRVAPFGPLAVAVGAVTGAAAGGWDIGWSAAIGVAVVLANFAANGLSLAWAARISPTVLAAVAMGGFVLRLGVVASLIFALDRFEWFSPLAFGLAVVPATTLLLGYEIKLLARGLGSELRLGPTAERVGR
jgi:hypothetical protein